MTEQIESEAQTVVAALEKDEASVPELIKETGLGESAARLALVWLLGAGRVCYRLEIGRAKSWVGGA